MSSRCIFLCCSNIITADNKEGESVIIRHENPNKRIKRGMLEIKGLAYNHLTTKAGLTSSYYTQTIC